MTSHYQKFGVILLKFSIGFKYFWWGFLIVLCIALLFLRLDLLKLGGLSSLDTIIIAVFIILILIPFFSEMSFLGFSIKQQISEVKNEVIKEIDTLRTDVNTFFDIQNGIKQEFYFGTQTIPDDQLDKIKERIINDLNSISNKKGVNIPPGQIKDIKIPTDTELFFSARYQIENELRRIWHNNFGGTKPIKNYALRNMMWDLKGRKIMPPSMLDIIREVFIVVTPVIHGEKPTENQIDFINKVVPNLIASLKEID